jgi:hypothetical protein
MWGRSMKYMRVTGALLALVLAGTFATASRGAEVYRVSGGEYDNFGIKGYDARKATICNCVKPDEVRNTREVIREQPRVIEETKYYTTNRVIPNVRVIEHNHVVVHEQPIVKKLTNIHQDNVTYKDITLNKRNITHEYKQDVKEEVENKREVNEQRIVEERDVTGVDCNCVPGSKKWHEWHTRRGGKYDRVTRSYRY